MAPENKSKRLRTLAKNLENASKEEIKDLLSETISQYPSVQFTIDSDNIIARAMENKGGRLFKNESRISYLKDKRDIEKHLTHYGRANLPLKPMFYGSVPSKGMPKPGVTAINETCNDILNTDPHLIKIVTVGHWKVDRPISVLLLSYIPEYIRADTEIREYYEHLFEDMPSQFDKRCITSNLTFLSHEFSKWVRYSWEYKVSAIFTDLVLEKIECDGVLFPSVASGFFGLNVALKPNIVDSKTTLDSVFCCKVSKNNQIEYLGKVLNINNGDFIWDINDAFIQSQKL